jgi:hypothetical protein
MLTFSAVGFFGAVYYAAWAILWWLFRKALHQWRMWNLVETHWRNHAARRRPISAGVAVWVHTNTMVQQIGHANFSGGSLVMNLPDEIFNSVSSFFTARELAIFQCISKDWVRATNKFWTRRVTGQYLDEFRMQSQNPRVVNTPAWRLHMLVSAHSKRPLSAVQGLHQNPLSALQESNGLYQRVHLADVLHDKQDETGYLMLQLICSLTGLAMHVVLAAIFDYSWCLDMSRFAIVLNLSAPTVVLLCFRFRVWNASRILVLWLSVMVGIQTFLLIDCSAWYLLQLMVYRVDAPDMILCMLHFRWTSIAALVLLRRYALDLIRHWDLNAVAQALVAVDWDYRYCVTTCMMRFAALPLLLIVDVCDPSMVSRGLAASWLCAEFYLRDANAERKRATD